MASNTSIEWTDYTWNPIRGCSRVSDGCGNCYAERQAYRFSGAGQGYEGLAVLKNGHASWTGVIDLVEKHLLDPLKWGPVKEKAFDPEDACEFVVSSRPRRIFVNSMSDLFHENVPDEWLDRIFAVMALCPQHTFQVLTKRPDRMLDYLVRREESGPKWRIQAIIEAALNVAARAPRPAAVGRKHFEVWPLPNVWLGVSVENQAAADERIPLLLKTPAAMRFISAEPLLGPVGLTSIRYRDEDVDCLWNSLTAYHEVLNSNSMDIVQTAEDGVTKLDWVICGGESGPGARPMHPDWARGLRDQCTVAGVPFFFKQWGEWVKYIDRDVEDLDWRQDYTRIENSRTLRFLNFNGGCGFHGKRLHVMQRVGKKKAGALLDGKEHKAFPEACR